MSILPVIFRGAALLVEDRYSVVDELEELVAMNLQVVRLHDGLIDFLDEHFSPDFLSERRMIFFQEAALPRQRLDHTHAFQLGICFRDRVPVDAQFFSKRPDARQRFTGFQCARRCSRLDLIDNLQVNGLPGFVIQLQQHGRLS